MANYIPFGTTPIQTRDYGPLAGIDTADREFLNRQAQLRSLEDMFTANQQRQAELERYRGETPANLAESNLAEMLFNQARGTPGYGESYVRGKLGEFGKAEATGREALGTVESKISIQLSKAQQTRLENGIKQLDLLMPMLKQAGSTPDGGASVVKQALSLFPPQIAQRLQGLPPQALPNVLERISQELKTRLVQSPEHLGRLEEIKGTGQWHKEVEGIRGRNQLAVEQARGTRRGKSYQEMLAKGDPGQRLAVVAMIEADSEVDPTVVQSAQAVKAQAAMELAARLQVKLPPMMPGMPLPPATELINQIRQLAQGGQPGQPQPGAGPTIKFGDLPK